METPYAKPEAAGDHEFYEETIAKVSPHGDGWSFENDKGWSISVPKHAGIEPKPGQVARYYGRGIGYPVRGLFIDGQEAWYRTPEEERRLAQEQSEAWDRERQEREERVARESLTEEQMRDMDVPWPKSEEDLMSFISGLVNRPHTYGTCVYALSMAATAAFYYACHELGVTGFQAGMAELDFIRRTRGIKGPFAILNGEDMLYPQYDVNAMVQGYMEKWRPWAAEEARKKLAEAEDRAHPNVVRHWKELAGIEQ